jgi:DNA-directed RNA polymerase specialized sigma24 family protein
MPNACIRRNEEVVEPAEGWASMVRSYDRWLRRRVSQAMKGVGLRPVPEQVVEMVQEVYCRLLEGGPPRLRRLHQLSLQAVLTYLGRVVDSVVTDRMRAESAAKRGGCRVLRMGRRVRLRAERIPDPAPSPDRALLMSERRRHFLRRFRSVRDFGPSERNAQIVWLALVEGWKSRELARAFELAPRTVDTLIHRVRRSLAHQGLNLRRRGGI